MPGLALGFPTSRVGSGAFGLVFGPGLGSAVPGVALVLLWLQENLPVFFLFASFSLLVLFDNNRATYLLVHGIELGFLFYPIPLPFFSIT